MVLARWQATIVDDAGNVQPAASVEVRREMTGSPLAVIYSDRAGATPISNPMAADGDGFAAFHVPGGSYKITATKGSFSRTWRYVGVGLASEQDAVAAGVLYIFDTATADADPGPGTFRLDNATPGSATHIYIDNSDASGNLQTTWIDSFDDGGASGDRGVIVLRSADNVALLVARITGSVVDGSGYRKLPISVLASSDASAFAAGATFGVMFSRSGANGTDGVFTGGEAVVVAALSDHVALYDASDSNNAKQALVSTLGVGRHTVWVPAGAMTARTTNGAASGTVETTTNKVMFKTLDFDATTQEFAQFSIRMPKGWDEGTVNAQFVWSHASTTTNFGVVWGLSAVALSDDDAGDAAFGTAQSIADTGGTTNDIYITAQLGTPVTIGGSPAEGDLVVFQVSRNPSDGSDTMAIDARLHGINLLYTTNANTDD